MKRRVRVMVLYITLLLAAGTRVGVLVGAAVDGQVRWSLQNRVSK